MATNSAPPHNRWFRTTALRLVLGTLGIYFLVLLVSLGAWFLASELVVTAQVQNRMQQQHRYLLNTYQQQGLQALQQAIEAKIEEEPQSLFLLLEDKEGKRLSGNLLAWPEPLDVQPEIQKRWISTALLPSYKAHDPEQDEVYWPVLVTRLSGNERLLLAHSVEHLEGLYDLTEFLFEAVGFSLLISGLVAWFISRAILARIEHIRDTASEIMSGDLGRRIATSSRNDEFDQLADHLNSMLERIQQLISGMRETTDNVAHDLRRPLTRLRNRLEVALLEPRRESEYHKVIQQTIDDTDSLIQTFNAILQISRLEYGNQRSQWQQFDLGELAKDIGEIYRPLAEEKRQTMELQIQGDNQLYADRNLLAQAISNLLDNAIRYTPDQGGINLRVWHEHSAIYLQVNDNGPGIPEKEYEHVLERFVRLESSRHTSGNGLGLSLIRAICDHHEADLRLSPLSPGLRVTVAFDNQVTAAPQ